jgi:hypothetical protein
MIIKTKICYSKLLWLMANRKFMESVDKISFTRPEYNYEGIAGYIAVNVEFGVNNLSVFALESESHWWKLTADERSRLYGLALKGHVCA